MVGNRTTRGHLSLGLSTANGKGTGPAPVRERSQVSTALSATACSAAFGNLYSTTVMRLRTPGRRLTEAQWKIAGGQLDPGWESPSRQESRRITLQALAI